MVTTEVREGDLVGTFGCPDGEGPFDGVLALGGSDGGIPDYLLRLLVPEGFACLALAYFNTPDTQPALVEVPLERIERGLRWMQAHPKVTARGDCGLDEMKRVANRLVVLTIEPTELGNFWLTEVYFPEIVTLDRGRCPSTAEIEHHLGDCRVDRIPIPHDCCDGFLGAFWRRPEAYLDPKVRAGMSGFTLLDADIVARGVAQLESDLETGAWERRFGHIRSLDALDVCYRLVVTD